MLSLALPVVFAENVPNCYKKRWNIQYGASEPESNPWPSVHRLLTPTTDFFKDVEYELPYSQGLIKQWIKSLSVDMPQDDC